MVEEMKGEVMELVVTACEKHSTNNEVSYTSCFLLKVVHNYVPLTFYYEMQSQLYMDI
jgi:hypothetical protein